MTTGRQESYSAEATTSTAQFTEEPELAEMRPAAPCPSVAMRGRPLHHSAPPEPTEDAGPIPQHAAQPRAAVEVPQPAVGRGASRHGRVKTRLLGFNTAMETDADPMLENDKAGAAPYTSFPVGWLIVVDGPGRGSAFTLFQGVSTIGRGEDQTVRLDFGDNSISRAGHASIAYDIRQKGFFIGHGGKANIVRRNDRPVLSTEELAAGDTIMIGETSLRFVPLCCRDFSPGSGNRDGPCLCKPRLISPTIPQWSPSLGAESGKRMRSPRISHRANHSVLSCWRTAWEDTSRGHCQQDRCYRGFQWPENAIRGPGTS